MLLDSRETRGPLGLLVQQEQRDPLGLRAYTAIRELQALKVCRVFKVKSDQRAQLEKRAQQALKA